MLNLMRRCAPVALSTLVIFGAIGCGDSEEEPKKNPPSLNNQNKVCSELTPVCDPGCAASQFCKFDGAAGACGCETLCDSAVPVCVGSGPNSGCGADEFCNTSCECKPAITCRPDAPVCPGNGPNAGCQANEKCSADCLTCEPKDPPPPQGILPRPSRTSSVDISADDSTVVMINSDNGSLTVFDAVKGERRAIIATSASATSEPFAVVLSPDAKTAFVANRAAGTVSRITGIDTESPKLQGEVSTVGEPVGVALSPTGATLWVSDWTAGTVTSIDTATFAVKTIIKVGGNPFAIAVTNDGDTEDSDEKVLVTQFFGRYQGKEAKDDGRVGVVHVIPVGATAPSKEILLAPKPDCFSGKVGENTLSVSCFPNQLYGLTIHKAFGKTRAYVSSVAASPEGPVNFNFNMQALISVIDVDAEAEEGDRTVNLNDFVKKQVDNDGDDNKGRRFLNTLNAVGFVNADDKIIGYASAAGSDIVLRVVWKEDGSFEVGAPDALNIPVGQNPTGLTIKHGDIGTGAYVANLISRDLSFIAFSEQKTTQTIVSTPVPAAGAADFNVWKGKRFFNTSTGIWSKEGWGSCQGCHPMGLTDNVTWSFAAGPRQTISLDGQYSSKNPNDMRALNWTAIFDETQDFELNTRGVSGGAGSLQNGDGPLVGNAAPSPFGGLLMEDNTTRETHQALNGSMRFIADNQTVCSNRNTCPDFNLIDDYIKTIRSPRGKKDEAAVLERGKALFAEGGCAKCHGGDKWTISTTFYNPSTFTGALPDRVFATIAATMLPIPGLGSLNTDTNAVAGDDSDGGTPAFKRIACNVRNVGTFAAKGGADEIRANNSPAQGQKGFNPPSLLGLSTGAPYLHNGAAADLKALFGPDFSAHTSAGNVNFGPTGTDLDALVAYLLSIDEDTPTFDVPESSLICPKL